MPGNRERGELAVDVPERQRTFTLRPTFNSICELEGLVDKPFDAILRSVQEGRVSGLRAVVWCLLQDKHASDIRSLKDASEWIEAVGGPEIALEHVYTVFGLNLDRAMGTAGSDSADPHAAPAGISAGSLSRPDGSA